MSRSRDCSVRSFAPVSILATLALVTLLPACQGTMSVEEAKKVAASFSGSAFVPPRRSGASRWR